jgi:hypothetical protein
MPPDDDSGLLVELRAVAKRGLDDPALLAGLDGLLELIVLPSDNAGVGASQRWVYLAQTLRVVLTELADLESSFTPIGVGLPSRREALNGLFMLTDEWKGKGITTRRRELAGSAPADNETSSFRRTVEEPLYKLVLSALRDSARRSFLPDSGGSRLDLAVAAVYRAQLAARAVARIEEYLDVRPLDGDEEGEYRALEMVLFSYEAIEQALQARPLPAERDAMGADNYDTWYEALGRIDGAYPPHDVLPLSRRELLSSLSVFKQGLGPFRDYLDDQPRGQHLLIKWRAWLKELGITSDNRPMYFMVRCVEAGQILLERSSLSPDQRFQIEANQDRLLRYLVDDD